MLLDSKLRMDNCTDSFMAEGATKLKEIWRQSKDVSPSQFVLNIALPFDSLALNKQVCCFEEVSLPFLFNK